MQPYMHCFLYFSHFLQFMDRLKLLLMPAKHQPDLIYLRHVPLRKVHLFTFIQILCLALLWILKSTVAAIIFPVMVRHLCGERRRLVVCLRTNQLLIVAPFADVKRRLLVLLLFQILALVAVRKAMDYMFSQHDLSFLDDVIPEKDKKKKEDEKKKRSSLGSDAEDVSISSSHQFTPPPPTRPGTFSSVCSSMKHLTLPGKNN